MENPENRQLTLDQLPAWMRPRQRRPDYALLGIVVLCLVVALPWITHSGLPNTYSAQAEIARIAEVADSLESGVVYPRWASHFHFGYGSPIFNYLAPAPHYLGGLIMLFTQTTALSTLKVMIVINIFLAGVGMFSFVRRRWGDVAGTLAAILYLMSPQIIYRHTLELDLSLMMAAGVFPCVLWIVDRTLITGDRRDVAALSILAALLITTSNLMGILMMVMVCMWAIWMLRQGGHRQAVFIGIAIGIGLTAIYWLPAITEARQVHWVTLDNNNRTLSLTEVLRLPRLWDVLNPSIGGELGVATWALGLSGLAGIGFTWWTHRRDALPEILPFILLGSSLLGVAVGFKNEWLDNTAAFPHLSRLDLLIPVTLCLTLLAAQGIYLLQERFQQAHSRLFAAGILGLTLFVIGVSSTQVSPAFVAYPAGNTIDTYMQNELRGVFSGSFRDGQLLPVEASELPPPSFPLLASYALGEVLKVESTSRLSSSNLNVISHGAQHDTLRVNAIQETDIEILTLNFEGWRATFQNDLIPLTTSPDRGFIILTVPPGRGDLNIHLGSTPARTFGVIISMVSLISLFTLLWRLQVGLFPMPSPFNLSLAVLSVGVSLLSAGGIFALQNLDLSPAMPSYQTIDATFEEDLRLRGYDLNQTNIEAGDVLDLTLYWEALRPNLPDYEAKVTFISKTDAESFSQHRRALGGWLTSFWMPETLVQDRYGIRIPQNIGRGEYDIFIELLRCESSDNPYTCREPSSLTASNGKTFLVLPESITVE